MLPVSLEVTVPLSTIALVLIACGISGAIVALIIAVVGLYKKVQHMDEFLGILWDETFDGSQEPTPLTIEANGKSSDTAQTDDTE
jgi:hypothetical protein